MLLRGAKTAILGIGALLLGGFLIILSRQPHGGSGGGARPIRGTESTEVLVARLRRVVDQMVALERQHVVPGGGGGGKTPASGVAIPPSGPAGLGCCGLARVHSVVVDKTWGTLSAPLQEWWHANGCDAEVAAGGCTSAPGPRGGLPAATEVIRLRRELNASKQHLDSLAATVTKLTAELGKAGRRGADGGATAAAAQVAARPGRKGVVMSCPSGRKVGYNAGTWKPSDPFVGVRAVAEHLAAQNSPLELVSVHFPGDNSHPACEKLQRELGDRLHMTCHESSERLPAGYGVPKVEAVLQAPLDEVIWLDCDTFPVADPMLLLGDPTYRETGAMFWPDIEDHFDETKLKQLYNAGEIDAARFPPNSWRTAIGFDSGVLVIDKTKSKGVLDRLHKMAAEYGTKWSSITHGDKDLWHLAWMLHGQDFAYVPYVGALGFFGASDKFCMTAQVKFSMAGEAAVTHQLWRDCGSGHPNFFGKEWGGVTPELGGTTRFNPPDFTLRYDLRKTGPDFRYARVGDKFPEARRQQFQGVSDWDHITKADGFGPDNMYPTSNRIRRQIARLARLWSYQ